MMQSINLPSSNETLPKQFTIRTLELGDFHKGFLDCLKELSDIGTVSYDNFCLQYKEMQREGVYYIVVIEDTTLRRVVATGTLIIERKFLHSCGKAGHIEDIVVVGSYRGQHLGQHIIKQLKDIAKSHNCYKVILDCKESNVLFYQKSKFERKEIQMAHYFPKEE